MIIEWSRIEGARKDRKQKEGERGGGGGERREVGDGVGHGGLKEGACE